MKNEVMYKPTKDMRKQMVDLLVLPDSPGQYALIQGFRRAVNGTAYYTVTLRHQITRHWLRHLLKTNKLDSVRITPINDGAAVNAVMDQIMPAAPIT